MDIEKKLEEKNILLVKVNSESFNSTILKTVKKLSKKRVCYITLNKTYSALKENLEKEGVNMDNVYFIDAISGTIKKPSKSKYVFFASSPSALTEISLAIKKFLKKDFDYIIFDSINNLLTYHNKKDAERFINSVINKIKESKTKSIFYALETKEQEELMKKTSTFVDDTISMGSGGEKK